MNCVNHETRIGTNTCSKCGHWLCDECGVDIDGRIVCKRCVAELLNANGYRSEPMEARRYEHRYEHSGERPECYARAPEHHEHHRARRYKHVEYAHPAVGRRISRFWLLMFSCVPGLNYMFMGLIKRGIYALSAFLLAAYFASTLGSPLIAIVTAVIYTVSVFDGFKVRRMLLNGEYVEDGFSGITNQLYRHRKPLVIVALLLIASSFFSGTCYSYGYYPWMAVNTRSIFMLILIAAVAYFFLKPVRRAKKDPESDYIDKRDQY